MPPITKSGAANRVGVARVICLICKYPVEEGREKTGKVVRRDCEAILLGNKHVSSARKVVSVKDFMQEKRAQEEKVFLDLMKRVLERIF